MEDDNIDMLLTIFNTIYNTAHVPTDWLSQKSGKLQGSPSDQLNEPSNQHVFWNPSNENVPRATKKTKQLDTISFQDKNAIQR